MYKLLTTIILTLCLASVKGVPKQNLQKDYDYGSTITGWWDWWTATHAWWWSAAALGNSTTAPDNSTAEPENSTEATTKTTPITCLFNCSHENDGDYPDPASTCTSHYYVCANGYCFNYYCPDELVYDYVNDECIYPQNWPGCD